MKTKWLIFFGGIVILGGMSALYDYYPVILYNVMSWQKSFHFTLSKALNELQAHRWEAGLMLLLTSFLYGVFHAVGPGHGKFILTSYLALEQTKLRQALKLSLLSSLLQGFVAILLVSVIVVIFTLSRQQFNLAVNRVEQGSFVLIILLGIYWCYLAWKNWRKQHKKVLPKIKKIRPLASGLKMVQIRQSHQYDELCSCGHRHLPKQEELQQLQDWKSKLMLILSIGSRPCSGAILMLFLAYTMDLYLWGIISALVMAIGTGLTLSMFAFVVVGARRQAIKLQHFYAQKALNPQLKYYVQFVLGILLIVMGIILLHAAILTPVANGLFRR